MPLAQIGVTGLAVMGRNLARNFARNGFTVAVHNRSAEKMHSLIADHGDEGEFIGSESSRDSLPITATRANLSAASPSRTLWPR